MLSPRFLRGDFYLQNVLVALVVMQVDVAKRLFLMYGFMCMASFQEFGHGAIIRANYFIRCNVCAV